MPVSLSGAASGAAAGSAFGPWGTAIGGIVGLFAGGKKAKAPALAPPIDLNAEAQKSIAGNTANEGDIESLLARANTFNQDQNISLMEKAMPGYTALSKSLTSTAEGELAHPYDVPADVTANIQRLAAEHGISAGTKGEFNDFSLLRDFGINSLQYGQQRIGQAQGIFGQLAAAAPKVNPLSPLSFYVTPGQSAQVAAGNQSAQQAGNNATAAADNYNTANDWNSLVKAAGLLGTTWQNGNRVPSSEGGAYGNGGSD
jgi:hypothetical protein